MNIYIYIVILVCVFYLLMISKINKLELFIENDEKNYVI